MDFWDLTKLLLRRWLIAVPLLLLSIGATVWTGLSIKPDYSATGYVQLIPPAVPPETADKAGHVRNRWADLGVEAMGQAVMITVRTDAVRRSLDADGFTNNFTVTMDSRSPIVTIEAVGTTPEQASGTVRRIAFLVDQDVTAKQKAYSIPQNESITTLTLDAGDNVQKVGSKVKRALIVVAGVGVLLTVAITIAVDALLRRRRRPAPDEPGADAGSEAKVVVTGARQQRAGARDAKADGGKSKATGSKKVPARVFRSAANGTADDEDSAATTRISFGRAGDGQPRAANGRPTAGVDAAARKSAAVKVEYQPAAAESDDPGTDTDTDGPDDLPIPDDATIVLPLSGAQWSEREIKGRQH